MPKLIAQDVNLVFPLYGQAVETAGDEANDPRLLRRGGKIVGVKALEDISLSLNAGDKLAVIGRNGSGKTSLLRVLAGLLPPDRGEVVVEGHATNLININLGLRPQASGHRNITLLGLAAGRTREQIEAVRPDIVAFSELGSFIGMPVSGYSAGMRTRLSFAIATAFEPGVLILDEWLSTGDASFRQKASDRMQGFVANAGILVLASHGRPLLEQNCNLGLWMRHGRIERFGPVSEVLDGYEASL